MSNQTLTKKVNEPLKTIFYLSHYASLSSKTNFKIDHAHSSKLCLPKCTILLEKQHFRIFQHSNIRNETKGINKNHFLSYTLCISVKVSKFQNRPRPLFKTVSAQMHYFSWKSTFSSFSAWNNCNESRWVNKNHLLSDTLTISVKVSKFKNWIHPLFKTASAQTCCFKYKKLNFRVFESPNTRNKNQQVNKSLFLSSTALHKSK